MPSEELISDYSILPSLEKEKREENAAFKRFLKKFNSSQVDETFVPIAEEVTSKIDCKECGNCCRHLEPGISHEEAGTLALLKGMPKEIFLRDYTGQEATTNKLFLNHQPCIFFDGKLCTIYDQRPASCNDFPHLSRGNFKFRFKSIMSNYSVCPIVFNTVEQLKKALSFVSK